MPVIGAASALAEGTAGVEPAGKAKIATAAKLEALVPWAQGEPGREVNSLPIRSWTSHHQRTGATTSHRRRKARVNKRRCHKSANARVPERGQDANPKSRRCRRMSTWSIHHRHKRVNANAPNRRRRESTWSTHHHERASANAAQRHKVAQTGANSSPTWPRESHRTKTTYIIKNRKKMTKFPSRPRKRGPGRGNTSTRQGPSPWDLGGRPPREQHFKLKRPVEAMDIAPGIDAHTKETWSQKNKSAGTTSTRRPQTSSLFILVPFHRPELVPSRSDLFIISRPIERAWRRPGNCKGVATGHQRGCLVAVTLTSRTSLQLPVACTLDFLLI